MQWNHADQAILGTIVAMQEFSLPTLYVELNIATSLYCFSVLSFQPDGSISAVTQQVPIVCVLHKRPADVNICQVYKSLSRDQRTHPRGTKRVAREHE